MTKFPSKLKCDWNLISKFQLGIPFNWNSFFRPVLSSLGLYAWKSTNDC